MGRSPSAACGRRAAPDAGGTRRAVRGTDEDADAWVASASLIETCELYGVDPQGYLVGLLTRLIEAWPRSRIGELLTWRSAQISQS